ncbi:MAG: hypothetical protein H6Q59_1322 [Firmicutes bacterium]|nr:hypothetical protein [Bacillota bacterium]
MGLSPFSGFSIMFAIIPVLVVLVFVLVFGIIIARFVQGAQQWKRNNDSPVLTVDAAVVTKRSDVSYYHNDVGTDNMHHSSSSTTYYVTFEVASGDRMEFQTKDTEYGLLVEHDTGKLTFQGTRYLGFERS